MTLWIRALRGLGVCLLIGACDDGADALRIACADCDARAPRLPDFAGPSNVATWDAAGPDIGPDVAGEVLDDPDSCAGVECGPPPNACFSEATCVEGRCYHLPLAVDCDDGDPCTNDDRCDQGVCAGVPLQCEPAPPICVGDTLRVAGEGVCEAGECVFAESEIGCVGGCVDGQCVVDPCRDIVCDAPPDGCHAATGICHDGFCDYAKSLGASCDDGDPCTVGDACTEQGCRGLTLTCEAATRPGCADSHTRVVVTQLGECAEGGCAYTATETHCPHGCDEGACRPDPCAGVVCHARPDACHSLVGTCREGVCVYPPLTGAFCDDGDDCTATDSCAAGVCRGTPFACDRPPEPQCRDGSLMLAEGSGGTCRTDGECDYPMITMSCSFGCTAGACRSGP